jgi:hypothetical protein
MHCRLLPIIVLAGLCAVTATALRAEGKGDAPAPVTVRKLAEGGPWEIAEGDRPILRYNYQMVRESAESKRSVSAANRKYSVDRCDYLHPLYGLNGEVLTEDWPKDHPHHRGIYWAWPEVDWQGQRGDLHALQTVFAVPTGKIRATEGEGFAQIEAENQWRWNRTTPIVREEVTLRAWRLKAEGRQIDLEFRFTAIDDKVEVARRDRSHYGGLNFRFGPLAGQQIVPFTDPVAASPRMTWAERAGTIDGRSIAMTILQHPANPGYPGDWVQYPNLSWIQPTFPASGTRWAITKDRPLELRFRLWIHPRRPETELLRKLWRELEKK